MLLVYNRGLHMKSWIWTVVVYQFIATSLTHYKILVMNPSQYFWEMMEEVTDMTGLVKYVRLLFLQDLLVAVL